MYVSAIDVAARLESISPIFGCDISFKIDSQAPIEAFIFGNIGNLKVWLGSNGHSLNASALGDP